MYADRTSSGVRVTLEGPEHRLLADLVAVLADLVEPLAPRACDDPFAQWEADFGAGTASPEPPDDPLHPRLFPSAYRAGDDGARPAGADDFERFSRGVEAQQRLAEAEVVASDLGRITEAGRLVITPDHTDAWLRTLNAVNLVLTSRLGIVDVISADEVAAAAADEHDPRSFTFHVHQWVAGVMETILDLL